MQIMIKFISTVILFIPFVFIGQTFNYSFTGKDASLKALKCEYDAHIKVNVEGYKMKKVKFTCSNADVTIKRLTNEVLSVNVYREIEGATITATYKGENIGSIEIPVACDPLPVVKLAGVTNNGNVTVSKLTSADELTVVDKYDGTKYKIASCEFFYVVDGKVETFKIKDFSKEKEKIAGIFKKIQELAPGTRLSITKIKLDSGVIDENERLSAQFKLQ